MKLLLTVENLSVSFVQKNKIFKAVDSVSFSINKSETLGIVGESGSGKTVSSLAIMGLLQEETARIESGRIIYFPNDKTSVDLLSLTSKEREKLRGKTFSMIFQEPMTSLNPVKKCGWQVGECFHIHQKELDAKDIKNRVLELFSEVRLPNPEKAYNSYPHELSGGQKQRVMIAMAISQHPELLIADEPTTALDVTVQKNILQLLKELVNKYGMSMIFISHDLGVISEIADRVCVMYKGKLVEEGFTSTILRNPEHPYTKGLIACRPPLDKRPERLLTVSDFLSDNKKTPVLISSNDRQLRLEKLYTQPPLLEVKKLSVKYNTQKSFLKKKTNVFTAVDSVSFSVWPGETLGLVGESGCGKTTLGRTILQLIKASDGNISYKGKELTQLESSELRLLRKDIQIIFQDPYSSLNPRLTVGEAIIEPMLVHKIADSKEERKKLCINLLERVGLNAEAMQKYPHEFSGGQRQRICIARALAVMPQLVICDESVSALDVSVQAQVLNLLNDLKKDYGLTYIFISHDLSVVRYMSDRIIVMNQGKIAEIGEADALFTNPQSDYTAKLLDAIPR